MALEATDLKVATKRPFRRRKQLEQNLEHVNQEVYRKNLELFETTQTLSLLRTIDSVVLESQDSLQATCTQIAQSITSQRDYPFVAILVHNHHRLAGELHLSGWSIKNVLSDEPIPNLELDISKNSWIASEERTRVVDLEKLTAKEIAHHLGCSVEVIQTVYQKITAKSAYVIKLMARQKLVGVMVVGSGSSVHDEQHMNTELLDRLGEAVGVAVDNKLLFDENQHVLGQLQHSNQKLKELDEAKDEFISMASHQLRTPLTSMKGYVSMVMEGDAGKINTMQRKLLDQAFVSSQRMVYLIADLLNVSRLRTGKFIIESKATNLAQLVEEEISQLYETAKGRKLELSYKKPKDFPELVMDETKIRQVVMNFTDNAIYYTPAGGHIHVIVEDKPTTVEFREEDDGLGVPKAEQHKMFTKFYRAGNARKARPDGTGLGLFMAKKVIAAQGGAIIFKSTEGKGSTFGFSFSKNKLAVPAGHQKTAPKEKKNKLKQ